MTTILVADDSAVAAKLISNILESGGHRALIATDGIEAAQMAFREVPDLILLDVFMPRLNGYQVCRLLKNDAATAQIPVIINTATDPRAAEFWSLHTGADAFLPKGYAPAELLSVTRGLLAGRDISETDSPAPREVAAEDLLSRVSALEQKELYDATVHRLELQTILQNLSEGILMLDLEGRVTSANRFLCRLLGRSEAELVGQPGRDVLGEPAGADALFLIMAALQGDILAAQDSEVRGRGGQMPVSLSVAPVYGYLGEVIGCVCLIQDISRRKQVEMLSQLKNDLTDMIVHDMRTPLTSLMAGVQSMTILGSLNERQQKLLDITVRGGQTLLGLINDLLDISKMEDGSLLLEQSEVLVEDVINEAAQQVAELTIIENQTLEFSIADNLPPLRADAGKVRRVLVNLLGNAIKFTPRGGTITLGAKLNETENEEEMFVEFRVADTGEGIPKSAFERIFQKFGQVETRQAGHKLSTGLGLTFCKMAVEAQGGKIWLESQVGQGSTFYFSIPIAETKVETKVETTETIEAKEEA